MRPTINGLKWLLGDDPPARTRSAAPHLAQRPAESNGRDAAATPRTLDISFDYVAWLQETWVDSLRAHWHVVLGPHARLLGGPGPALPERHLSRVPDVGHPRLQRCALRRHSPDCSRAEQLDELCETVYRQRADLGLAFDGDGDCVALVDNEGMALTAEEATWVLLQTFGRQLRGERFVCDVKFSDRIREAAESPGPR